LPTGMHEYCRRRPVNHFELATDHFNNLLLGLTAAYNAAAGRC
jgi:hypothetical protein